MLANSLANVDCSCACFRSTYGHVVAVRNVFADSSAYVYCACSCFLTAQSDVVGVRNVFADGFAGCVRNFNLNWV